MRLLRRILLGLAVFLLVLAATLWVVLHSDFFWRWAGGKLISMAESECRCAIQVGSIEGNAFEGLFFNNITMATPEGKVIDAKSLELKISFWSLFKLSPLVTLLAVNEPHLDIHQEKDGEWNIIKIIPPAPEELPVNIVQVKFDHIKINNGDGVIKISGQTRKFWNLDVDTDLSVERPVTPSQSIKVAKALAAVTTSVGRINVNGSVAYANNYLDVEHIYISSGEKRLLTLVGRGNMAAGGEFKINGKLDIPPKDIHQFWAKWPLTWDFETDFQVQGTRSQFNLALNGKVQDVNFDINGKVGSEDDIWHYDINGVAKHLTPGLLTIFDKSLACKLDQLGPIDTKFHVQGTGLSFPPEKFAVNLVTEPFEYGTARVEQLKINLTGNKESQQLSGSLQGPFGDVTVEGSGALFTGKNGKFCVNLDSFKPAPLGINVPAGTVINATIGGNFSSPGLNSLDRLQVTLDITADGQIGQYPLNDAEAKIVWSKNELKVSRASLQMGNVFAELQGAMAGNKINFSFKANSSREGNWPIPSRVGGQLSAEGTATGTLSNPQIVVKANGHDLTYDKYAVKNFTLNAQVSGYSSSEGAAAGGLNPHIALKATAQDLTYDKYAVKSLTLDADISGYPPSRGRINLQAKGVKTPAGVFSQATFQSDGNGKLWNFDLKANGQKTPRIALRGTADFGQSSVTIAQAHIDLYNIKVDNQGPVEIVYSPGIEIRQANFTINQGKLSVQAKITQDQATGNLTLQNLPADLVLPESLPLKGVISAKATLSGTGRQPVINGNILLEPAQSKQEKQAKQQLAKLEQPEQPGQNRLFELQSVQTSFNYQDNRLSLTGSLQTRRKGVGLSWSGQVPIHLSLAPFAYSWGQGGMQLAVKGENLNLSLLPQLVKGVEDAQGPMTLQVKVEGAMSNPQITGNISWGQGSIRLRATGANYQLLPGSINMKGNRITIPQLTLQSDGTATLTGSIDLAGYQPADVRLRLQFANFKAIDKLKSEAYVNGTINLDGRYPNLAATGNLTIPKATFTLAFLNVGPTTVNKDVILVREEGAKKIKKPVTPQPKGATGPDVWENLRVDIRITAPRNVKVDDPRAKIEVTLNIAVRKQPGQELVYAGEVRALHGQVFLAGRTFQMTRGIVTLPPQPGADPVINGRIESELSTDVTLYAEVTGPASDPKITLGGEPAISETDWVAYLLYGKPVAYLSREQQNTASAAAGAFGGLAARVILKDLLGMAPTFTKGLTISYQQPSDPLYRDEPNQVVINYRINRRISVQSQVGGRNSGGDVLFHFDF